MEPKVVSYVMVRRDSEQALYWKYGQTGGWTKDPQDARRYAREASANAARLRLLKRPEMQSCKVEPIEE